MVFVFFKAPSLTCLDGDGERERQRETERERGRGRGRASDGGREGGSMNEAHGLHFSCACFFSVHARFHK